MSITPNRSKFRQVADAIRAAVQRGDHPRGEALPKEEELAEQLGVSRATVNDAIRVLVAEGLVRIHRGKGMFVTELPPIVRDAAVRHSRAHRERGGSRGSLATELAELGYRLRSDNSVGPGRPPDVVAEVLGVDAGTDSVIVRARHMFADDIPIQIATSYIPLSIGADTPIAELDSGVGGISSRLAELGHAQVEIEERITVRPPAPEEAGFLKMSEDQRVYEILHIGWTGDDRPVKATVYVMPTHQWSLRYRYPAEPLA
ncbi:GntR family transcriptional regulator [Streptosporangium sp. NPDC023615]|uniref:GntR family transcriptional regulator n=1 Tax=Streptosporangium sp. NPDC023615 TaxID=3154794 RepID=UPI0034206651